MQSSFHRHTLTLRRSRLLFVTEIVVAVVVAVVVHRSRIQIMVFKGQDAWRTHPLFQGLWKSPLPGFRNAVLIYGVYMMVDYGIQSMKPKAAIAHH